MASRPALEFRMLSLHVYHLNNSPILRLSDPRTLPWELRPLSANSNTRATAGSIPTKIKYRKSKSTIGGNTLEEEVQVWRPEAWYILRGMGKGTQLLLSIFSIIAVSNFPESAPHSRTPDTSLPTSGGMRPCTTWQQRETSRRHSRWGCFHVHCSVSLSSAFSAALLSPIDHRSTLSIPS